MTRIAAGLLILTLGLASPAWAATIHIQNSFGLDDPNTTLGFDALGGDGISVTDQFAGQGVVFTPAPGGGDLVTLYSDNFAGMDGFALNQGGTFQIQFLGTVTEAAFAFLTNPGTSMFRALLSGTEIQAFTAETSLASNAFPGTWFGFTGFTFDAIEVVPGGTNQAFRLDNLQYSEVAPVPLPAALPLFGTGLGILGFLGWRRRRKMAQAV